jgi:hypothetical protein
MEHTCLVQVTNPAFFYGTYRVPLIVPQQML